MDAFGDREYLLAAGEAPDLRRDGGPGQPPGPLPRRPGRRAWRPRRHLLAQQRRVGRDGVGRVQAASGLDQHQRPLREGRAPLPVRQRRLGGPGTPGPVRTAGGRAPARAAGAPAAGRIEDGSGVPLAEGTVPFEEAMVAGRPERDFAPRSTTTTTSSIPAGRRARPGGGVAPRGRLLRPRRRVDPHTDTCVERPEEMVERAWPARSPPAHGSAHPRGHPMAGDWPELRRQSDHPGPHFDPHTVWEPDHERGRRHVTIIGDAMGEPWGGARRTGPATTPRP